MNEGILVGIPTRDRPEYLSCLLATLMHQSCEMGWSVFIADTSKSPGLVIDDPQVKRFSDTLRALGHPVFCEKVPASGFSNATAVNRILTRAAIKGYEFVFKVDDDHVVPPDALSRLVKLLKDKELDGPVIVSGAIPWMFRPWEGALGPEDIMDLADFSEEESVVDLQFTEGTLELKPSVNHFLRYNGTKKPWRQSKFGADAEFMMRPDIRILWSDVGTSSVFADAMWFSQLRELLGYRFWFDLLLNIWHVAAPKGGVRTSDSDKDMFIKTESEDLYRIKCLKELFRELGEKQRIPNEQQR